MGLDGVSVSRVDGMAILPVCPADINAGVKRFKRADLKDGVQG